ncbi:hypothetical protein WN943_003372 [Citrus x changshan-huyou]
MAASSSKQFKNICVLSGFHYGKYKEFVQTAVDLDHVIAERKLHLVYGGGEQGLSRLVSEAVFTKGSQVLGIIPKAVKPLIKIQRLVKLQKSTSHVASFDSFDLAKERLRFGGLMGGSS